MNRKKALIIILVICCLALTPLVVLGITKLIDIREKENRVQQAMLQMELLAELEAQEDLDRLPPPFGETVSVEDTVETAEGNGMVSEGESSAELQTTPEPASDPTPEPTPVPTPVPTPEPTPVPTPKPTPVPTPTPVPVPTPTPFVSLRPAGLSWPSSAYDDGQIVIMLDAGHGGHDVGTMTKDKSVYEKDLNLDMVLKMKPLLEDRGVTVVLTRDSDNFVSLDDRANYCNELDTDAFVSIHVNSYDKSAKIGGLEVYFCPGSVPCSKLAGDLVAYAKNQGIVTNGVKSDEYFVLKHTDCTAVLVETGYITNVADRENLLNEEYRAGLAQILVDGILSSLGY